MKKYAVCYSENGDIIDVFDTHEEAANALMEFEENDLKEGIYEVSFYIIKEVEV